ncbi:hypothetical protein VaNZ11_008748, partial [Volvox africanus]
MYNTDSTDQQHQLFVIKTFYNMLQSTVSIYVSFQVKQTQAKPQIPSWALRFLTAPSCNCMSKVMSSKQTRYRKDLPSSQQRLSFSLGPSPKRSKVSEPGDAGAQRPHVPPRQGCLQQHLDASGSSFTSCPVCGKQVALLCISLHLDLGCADELPLLRAKPAAPFIGDIRSRPSALLVCHAMDPDSGPVQGPKKPQQEFDGGLRQAVLPVRVPSVAMKATASDSMPSMAQISRPDVPWRPSVSGDTSTGVTNHDGDPRDRSVGVRICMRKGLAGPGQLVGAAATAVAAVTMTADAIVGDSYGTKEHHVKEAVGDGNSEGRDGGASVMQQLGATHVTTTLSRGEDGVAVAVANEEREQKWEKKLQHALRSALVASSPHKFRAVPNPFLEGQYIVTEFITVAEEMELLALCDDPVLKPAWSPWIGQTYSNATAQKTRGKRWGVLPDYHRRGVAPQEHPLPPLLQLLAKRMREHIGILQMFQPNEANAIDYRRSRGSWLRPHVDDRILSGDLIVNLSLAGAAVMTFVKDKDKVKDKNKARDGVKEGSVYCSGPSRGSDAGQRVEPLLQQRSQHQRQQQSVGEEAQVGLAPRSLQILSRSARYNYTHAIAPSDLVDERRVSIT